MYFDYIFVGFILSMATKSRCSRCEAFDDKLQKLCHNVGYNHTANFPSKNGIRYQEKVYRNIYESQQWFSKCSKLSSLIVCSRYVPKCLEIESRPILPCKEVCDEFLENCAGKLEEKNQKLFYTALCHLLPNEKCLKPEGFQRSSKVIESLPTCPSSASFCQPQNISVISESKPEPSNITLSSHCTKDLKTYACYNQSTPCTFDNIPFLPCRSFCEKLKKNCSFIEWKCSDLPTQESHGNLCKMEHWPVPWPNKTKDFITCYCDICGLKNKRCQTNGSCFIQYQITNKEMTSVRTCLQPGKQRDFICSHDQEYPLARCCREDDCNKELPGMHSTPPPTKNPTTNASKVVPSLRSPTVSNVNNTNSAKALKSAYLTFGTGILILILQNQEAIKVDLNNILI